MDDWQVRLANMLTQGDVAALTKVLLLLGALTACSLYGLIQFITMLMTRWGDRNPAPKAFLLSILLHITLILSWYTGNVMYPFHFTRGLPSNVAAGAVIPIREVGEPGQGSDEGTDDHFETGNSPVWRRMSGPTDLAMTRGERDTDGGMEELGEAPRMASDASASVPAFGAGDLDDIAMELPDAAPAPSTAPSPGEMRIKAAAVPVDVAGDATATEVRSEARVNGGSRGSGRATQRTGKPVEVEIGEIPQTRGSGAGGTPGQSEDLALSIPVTNAGPAGGVPVMDAQPSSTIRKGAAPTPSGAPDGEFVPGGRTDADNKSTTPSRAGKFGRTLSRRATGVPSGSSTGTGNGDGTGDGSGDGTGDGDARMPSRIARSGDGLTGIGGGSVGSVGSIGDGIGGSPTPSLAPAAGPNLPNRSPAAYKLRKLEQRRGTALKQGGNIESERAVENSLKWLAKVQEPEGFWDTDKYGGGAVQKDPHGYDRNGGGKFADTGVTGLALLAFMGAGYTQDDGDYADNVSRGLKWLMTQQRGDGYLGGNASYFDQMYCHAIATIALAEACGMQDESDRSPELRKAIKLAVEFIVERQGTDGGWRYKKEQPGDMSMFGWQLMALKSADIAGVKAPPETWNAMIEFLKQRSLGDHSGLASYNQSQPAPTPAMTAEALFCKQMIGIRRSNPACQEAVAYIRKRLPNIRSYDEYYWYYGTMSMFQHGGEAWEEWNEATRDLIVRLQQTSGKFAGSWEPRGKWAGNGGRIYSTALSTLCLEVYYRYLPLYQSTQE